MKTIISSRQSRQQGFIQGAIIFALALIAIIIATFSSGSSDTADNVNKEQAKSYAGSIVAAGAKLYTAYLQAQTDRRVPFVNNAGNVAVIVGAASAPSPAGVGGQDTWALASYARLPTMDSGAFANDQTSNGWIFLDRKTNATDATCDTALCTLYLQLPGLKRSVCEAINFKVTSKPPKAGTATATVMYTVASDNYQVADVGSTGIEGCYNKGTVASPDYTYFKALHTNWSLTN
jgi:hypothetical protein